MMASLKAEFRKLMTVRSTYIITGLSLLLVIFYAGFIEGYKIDPVRLHDTGLLASEVTGAIAAVSTIAALVSVLLMSHEYRYSTIMYTLTSSNSRSRSLLAKILVVTGYIVVFAAIVSVLSPTATAIGIHLKHYTLVPQTFDIGDLAWRSMFFAWGYSMLGMLFALLFRNIVAAIAGLFLLPGTLESLLGLLLKHNQVYLPATALAAVIDKSPYITYTHAALVYMAYLVGGGIIAWVMFVRRDAN